MKTEYCKMWLPHRRWSPRSPSSRCWREEPRGRICLGSAGCQGNRPRWCCVQPPGSDSQTARGNPSWNARSLYRDTGTDSKVILSCRSGDILTGPVSHCPYDKGSSSSHEIMVCILIYWHLYINGQFNGQILVFFISRLDLANRRSQCI